MVVSLELYLSLIGAGLAIFSILYGVWRDRSGDITGLEHRLTSLEERSLSRDEVVSLHTLGTEVINLKRQVTDLCEDYKETTRLVYRDLPRSLKRVTAPKYDELLDRLSQLGPSLPIDEARKVYSLLKADHTRSKQKEDTGRMIITTILINRLERDFGLGQNGKKPFFEKGVLV